ncbi:MAG: hypothetical protein HZB38_19165 [Planctomycetes bacterium]|nr:hypothetical protein [Planctomycetota bacterium]
MRHFILLLMFCLSPFAEPAFADFIPGRLYVSGSAGPCDEGPNQAVFEFDPVTRESRMFAQLPEEICGFMTGLAFTPDGSRLRASVWDSSSIVEIDGDGSISVAYDHTDGLAGPYGSNNLLYDDDGDLYVVNSGADTILRFPQDAGPPEVFATGADGVIFAGPLARAGNNQVYYGAQSIRDPIYRISGPGQSEIFDWLPGDMRLSSMVSDAAGNLFVLANRAIFRYDSGDPTTRRQLTTFGGTPGDTVITISPDGRVLYAALGSGMYAINPSTGGSEFLGTVTNPTHEIGWGLAVAVPEPCAGILFGVAAALLARSCRGRLL